MQEKPLRVVGIILAAGKGRRMGLGMNKLFLPLDGQPVLLHTLKRWQQFRSIHELVVVAAHDERSQVERWVTQHGLDKVSQVVSGGQERQESALCGLEAVAAGPVPDLVLIHDGARPFVTEQQVEELIQTASLHGAAILGLPVKDTVKKVAPDGKVTATLNRSQLWRAQTPQGFKYELILDAHRQAARDGYEATDDAAVVERLGREVRIVAGSEHNIKLTTPDDIDWARFLLERERNHDTYRTGI